MSKKSLLLVSFLGVVLFFLSMFSTQLGICEINNYLCFQSLDVLVETVFIFIPLFVLSFVVLLVREEIFRSWLKFTYIWVPLTIILVRLSPEYGNSFLPIEKDTVSFFFSIIFLIVSLIIIITKHLSIKKRI